VQVGEDNTANETSKIKTKKIRIMKQILFTLTLMVCVPAFSQQREQITFKNHFEIKNDTIRAKKTTERNPITYFAKKFQTSKSSVSKTTKRSLDSIVIENSVKMVFTYDGNGYLTLDAQYLWNDAIKIWLPHRKSEYTYNGNGDLLIEAVYDGQDNTWRGYRKNEYSYNEAGNLTSKIEYNWSDNTWELRRKNEYVYENNVLILENGFYWWNEWHQHFKCEYTYDENLITAISYIPRGTDWRQLGKYEYTYNSEGYLITIIESSWQSDDWTDWRLGVRHEFTYDNNGNLTLKTRCTYDPHYIWDPELAIPVFAGDWRRNTKEEFTYDNNSNLTSEALYIWQSHLQSWWGNVKEEYEYDNKVNQIMHIYYWGQENDVWQKQRKTESIYDNDGNLSVSTNYSWNNNDWQEEHKSETIYDLSYFASDFIFPPFNGTPPFNNKPIETNYYEFSANNWTFSGKAVFYFSNANETNILNPITEQSFIISVFPNPVVSELYVEIKERDIVSYTIYNQIGQVVKQGKMQNSSSIDVHFFPKGMYYLQIVGKKTGVTKFVKK
jgi:hypothetical protein